MGKKDKKQRHQRPPPREASYYLEQDDEGHDYGNFSTSSKPPVSSDEEKEVKTEDEDGGVDCQNRSSDVPSKFLLYQQSVQSPKGDISYLLKFFLTYVRGRQPLHLQEDFCGTALLSVEWLRTDPRRTAVGLDFDIEALNWCSKNNLSQFGTDGCSRISLLHGNVLQPDEAKLVNFAPEDLIQKLSLKDIEDSHEAIEIDSALQVDSSTSTDDKCLETISDKLPPRDIICAFNYSCCCLHSRKDLVLYFKHVLRTLSKKGGIFVMDLYGGTSSERKLTLKRRFPDFTYTWEQAEFDIVERKTRISLHYHLQKQQKKLRHAFSYSWRLWSLPEIKDCLEEAGFQSVHFWLRQMPDCEEMKSTEGFGVGRELKYEEVDSFQQQDSWNAYIVGVPHRV